MIKQIISERFGTQTRAILGHPQLINQSTRAVYSADYETGLTGQWRQLGKNKLSSK